MPRRDELRFSSIAGLGCTEKYAGRKVPALKCCNTKLLGLLLIIHTLDTIYHTNLQGLRCSLLWFVVLTL
jgi:hypothetical protein